MIREKGVLLSGGTGSGASAETVSGSGFAASTARSGGIPFRQRMYRVIRDPIAALMRVRTEDIASSQRCGTLFHTAHAGVGALQGRGKLSGLNRCPHAPVLAWLHCPLEDDDFGSAADSGVQRAHEHFVASRRTQRFPPQLVRSGTGCPERFGLESCLS